METLQEFIERLAADDGNPLQEWAKNYGELDVEPHCNLDSCPDHTR